MELNINAKELGQSYELIPKGEYAVRITDTEVKTSKAGGTYISIRFTIMEGQPYAGRNVFGQYNIQVPGSPKAEEIGRKQLASIALACGIELLKDSDDLVNSELKIKIDTESVVGQPERNIVKNSGFKSIRGTTPVRPVSVQSQPVQPVQRAETDTIPW